MFFYKQIDKYSPIIDKPILGRTLPSLLDEACESYPDNRAVSYRKGKEWQSQSSQELRTAVEELALGLQAEQLKKGEKIALLMHSDRNFCLADFGSLLAGLVNVPIDLTQNLDNIVFILRHSAAKVLVISDLDLLAQLAPYLGETSSLRTIIVVEGVQNSELGIRNSELKTTNSLHSSHQSGIISSSKLKTPNSELETPNSSPACLNLPMLLGRAKQDVGCPELPQCIKLFSLDEVRAVGKQLWSEAKVRELRSQISPQDLATIIYIAGDTGQPKGVMLSHENITADILTTFANIPDLKPGETETVLSFLPLTHIFARAFLYGHLNYGHNIYFSTPSRVARDFKTVKPTLVATVPRMLEKIYQKIFDRGGKQTGIKKTVFNWALKLAQNYELGKPRSLSSDLQLKLANWLVFAQVRQPFGGRLKYFISGGAGLKAEIANVLSAAGMTIFQGYGLTETSSVICCNQADFNRAGTVGLPIPGVEIAIAPDQEILVKAPYVMQGYYQNPEATKAVIDPEGWLHTGDLGAFTPEGFLTITGGKKSLFKLSTGKYVSPQPLENSVKRSHLVSLAAVVGMQRKFCGMLIFPDLDKLPEYAQTLNLSLPITELFQHPQIIALYQTLVDEANKQLPKWSQVKRFRLVNADISAIDRLLDQDLKISRGRLYEIFESEINALYGEGNLRLSSELGVDSSELISSVRKNQDSPKLIVSSKLKLFIQKLRLQSLEFSLSYWQNKGQDLWQKIGIRKEDENNSQIYPSSDEQVPS